VRVVFAPHAYSPSIGGAERYSQGLAEGLARLGHEVHVVVADVDDPEAFYELGHHSVGPAEEKIGGVTVHRLVYAGLTYRMLGGVLSDERALRSSTKRYVRRLAERVSDLAPGVVVTMPHLFPNVEEIVRQRVAAPWKLVYAPMLHEDDPYWFVARVSKAVATSDGVVALTDHERDRLLDSYGSRADTTRVIPPGVEPGERTVNNDRDQAVLFIGRRTESKRLDVLYEAMKIVWNEFPEMVLQVAGSPPGMGHDPAIWMAADPRVKVINAPSEAEKDRLLGRARVVVSPSLTESFGITTLEAWAQGAPVVVTDSPVNRSVVRDGVDGLIAAGGEATGLARAIGQAARDPQFAGSMGHAGRRRVEIDFTWSRSATSLDQLIRAI
jgi:glycosyltransferase involved in cell wall biosynthesis